MPCVPREASTRLAQEIHGPNIALLCSEMSSLCIHLFACVTHRYALCMLLEEVRSLRWLQCILSLRRVLGAPSLQKKRGVFCVLCFLTRRCVHVGTTESDMVTRFWVWSASVQSLYNSEQRSLLGVPHTLCMHPTTPYHTSPLQHDVPQPQGLQWDDSCFHVPSTQPRPPHCPSASVAAPHPPKWLHTERHFQEALGQRARLRLMHSASGGTQGDRHCGPANIDLLKVMGG